jgi:hypothetical protein
MQKVVTVTTHTNVLNRDEKYIEVEYDKVNGYLEDGYKVVQVVPFTTNVSDSFRYTLTFVLEKQDGSEVILSI